MMNTYINTLTNTYKHDEEYVSHDDIREAVATFLHMGKALKGYRHIEGDVFSSELSIIPINAIESIDIY